MPHCSDEDSAPPGHREPTSPPVRPCGDGDGADEADDGEGADDAGKGKGKSNGADDAGKGKGKSNGADEAGNGEGDGAGNGDNGIVLVFPLGLGALVVSARGRILRSGRDLRIRRRRMGGDGQA